MDRNEKLNRLRKLLTQVADDVESLTVEEGLELEGASSNQQLDIARNAVEKLLQNSPNEAIQNSELQALESIVLPWCRPAILIHNGSFSTPSGPWSYLNSPAIRNRLQGAIASTGRIELPDNPTIPFAGAAFVVGDCLLMTARHVAEVFASGLGNSGLTFRPGPVLCDFKQEFDSVASQAVSVTDIVMIHPYWDMALLRVEGLQKGNLPLRLSVTSPEELLDRDVALIGYPAKDWRNDSVLQDHIFNSIYNVKRMLPGRLRQRQLVKSFDNEVNALTHDCSTASGTSGAAIVETATGDVVGLHFASAYLKGNYAVPMFELARDRRVVDMGLNFTGNLTPSGEWAAVWRHIDPLEFVENPLEHGTLTIERLEVKNIRCFRSATIDFGDANGPLTWNMILGDNASGKTTILRAIALGLVGQTEASSLLDKLPGQFLREGEKQGLIRIKVRSSKTNRRWVVETQLIRSKQGKPTLQRHTDPSDFPWNEVFVCGYSTNRTANLPISPEQYSPSAAVTNLFDPLSPLMNPEVVLLRHNPNHRAHVIRTMLSVLNLQSADDGIDVDPRGISVRGPWGRFPVDSLSDGYRSTIRWLSDFLGWQILSGRFGGHNPTGGILLIDELEQHLHPRWQRQIAARLRDRLPDVQIIASTHTPLTAAGVVDLDAASLIRLVTGSGLNEVEAHALDLEPLRGKRADQLLTSDAFGLVTTRSPGSVDDVARYTELASMKSRNQEQEMDLRVLEQQIESQLSLGETPLQQEIEQAVREVLDRRVSNLPSQLIDMEIKRQLQSLLKGDHDSDRLS
ncbi:MAG: AAA family ATPase [Planctomycetes bacterium]|nr:AAA family ATPase [Planctomycetota bacterium]